MEVYVECICGKKFHVDREQVDKFDCEGCGRALDVPSVKLEAQLKKLRERMTQGEPGMRDAMTAAAAAKNFHAVPLLKEGAESGMRESVNIALTGLADHPGPGHEVLLTWVKGHKLPISRFITALREQKFTKGADLICGMIEKGYLKENQIAEVAPYLGATDSVRALEVLKACRAKYPNLGGIFDDALHRMKHLDESAGEIPDSAKRIPGRAANPEAEEKKGCMGLLLAILAVIGILSAAMAVI